jgi:tRNA modification GTPase
LYLTQSVLRAVFSAGAVPAQPGEFTRRAFLNGKMSLTSAEAVMDLISAQGEQAARAALADKNGALERRIAGVKEKLISSAAHLAAWSDFPEEDIPEVTDDSLLAGLHGAKEEIGRLLRQFDIGSVIRDGVDTVILGRPNVGKSTLMNLLAGNEKSIVTSVAGTTRDIVEETVRAGEILLRLADTAGLRQTDDPVESIGVQRARERMASAQLILAVFDASEPLQEEDLRLLDTIDGRRAVAVINKSDLEQNEIFNKEYITNNLQHVVEVSAKQGKGVEDLIAEIASVLGTADWNPAEGMLSTERQRVAAEQALQCVEEALDAVALGMTLDAITVSIEGAIEALAELTGENVSEAVVDGVFHRFCVGK